MKSSRVIIDWTSSGLVTFLAFFHRVFWLFVFPSAMCFARDRSQEMQGLNESPRCRPNIAKHIDNEFTP